MIDKIKVLIDAASKEAVTFVYAISPGLDISFATTADVAALKRKMKQVQKMIIDTQNILNNSINNKILHKPSRFNND